MTNLTEIIKEDFTGTGRALRGIVSGAVQGIYTPALMTTAFRQWKDKLEIRDVSVIGPVAGIEIGDVSLVECVAKGTTQIVSALGIFGVLTGYALEQEKGLEYFGALALTNVADYLVHAYNRSKEPTRKSSGNFIGVV